MNDLNVPDRTAPEKLSKWRTSMAHAKNKKTTTTKKLNRDLKVEFANFSVYGFLLV